MQQEVNWLPCQCWSKRQYERLRMSKTTLETVRNCRKATNDETFTLLHFVGNNRMRALSHNYISLRMSNQTSIFLYWLETMQFTSTLQTHSHFTNFASRAVSDFYIEELLDTITLNYITFRAIDIASLACLGKCTLPRVWNAMEKVTNYTLVNTAKMRDR